jgi:hypothetical protein
MAGLRNTKHRNTETKKQRNTGTQEHRNKETQIHGSTGKIQKHGRFQKHKNPKHRNKET